METQLPKAKAKQVHYGEHGYLKTTPERVKKWAQLVRCPKLDLAFNQAVADADRAVDQLRATLNELRFSSPHDSIEKVRLITLTLKALDDRLNPPSDEN
jgi:hypothetical protein